MTLIDYAVLILFSVGVFVFLTTYLPFSPMTIDLVNLRRESQLKIFRHRKTLWTVGAVCFASVMLLGLTTAGVVWFWSVVVAALLLLFMFFHLKNENSII